MSGQPPPAEAEFTRLKGSPQDRLRGSVRYRSHLATLAHLTAVQDDRSQTAWLMNLSATGIGLLVGEPLAAGVAVRVQVKTAARATPHELSARVVHSTRQANGDWIAGCALDRHLTPEELDELLA